jgi:hypothetical protein
MSVPRKEYDYETLKCLLNVHSPPYLYPFLVEIAGC